MVHVKYNIISKTTWNTSSQVQQRVRAWYTCTNKYNIISKTTWNTSTQVQQGHNVRTYMVPLWYSVPYMVGNMVPIGTMVTWYTCTIRKLWHNNITSTNLVRTGTILYIPRMVRPRTYVLIIMLCHNFHVHWEPTYLVPNGIDNTRVPWYLVPSVRTRVPSGTRYSSTMVPWCTLSRIELWGFANSLRTVHVYVHDSTE